MKQPMNQWQHIVEFREKLIKQFKRPVSFSEAVSLWLYKINDESVTKASRKRRVRPGVQFPFLY
ncbi:MAG: hypothetical protein D6715_03720 [Calditrichaeota bacterium]|nr:MAG: hypothetical protein D6715_03720 [Calditrichota bacterium]